MPGALYSIRAVEHCTLHSTLQQLCQLSSVSIFYFIIVLKLILINSDQARCVVLQAYFQRLNTQEEIPGRSEGPVLYHLGAGSFIIIYYLT